MEIEPEVLDPQGRRRAPRPPRLKTWQTVLAAVAGVALLVGVAMVALWIALILIGIALIGGLVRWIIALFTGRPPRGGSGTRIVVYRSNRRP